MLLDTTVNVTGCYCKCYLTPHFPIPTAIFPLLPLPSSHSPLPSSNSLFPNPTALFPIFPFPTSQSHCHFPNLLIPNLPAPNSQPRGPFSTLLIPNFPIPTANSTALFPRFPLPNHRWGFPTLPTPYFPFPLLTFHPNPRGPLPTPYFPIFPLSTSLFLSLSAGHGSRQSFRIIFVSMENSVLRWTMANSANNLLMGWYNTPIDAMKLMCLKYWHMPSSADTAA